MQQCLGLEIDTPYAPWEVLSLSAGFRTVYPQFAMVSDFPTTLVAELHREDGPTHEWRDGFAIYHLNQVAVPEWLVTTREADLDPHKLLKIDNAEVRREFIRKVGIDRVCYSLNAKTIDTSGSYELLLLDLGDGRRRPYLKMRNPSIGTWHVEGVHPDCLTVEQSLNWRNGLDSDRVDDDAGSEWYQQGDVVIRPRGQSRFKSRPTILT